jgi:hypothetical protein
MPPMFRMFALPDHGACEVDSGRFFEAENAEGATAPQSALVIARELATKSWKDSAMKYTLRFTNEEARRCMKDAAHLRILRVKGMDATDRKLTYRVALGGCVDSGTNRS